MITARNISVLVGLLAVSACAASRTPDGSPISGSGASIGDDGDDDDSGGGETLDDGGSEAAATGTADGSADGSADATDAGDDADPTADPSGDPTDDPTADPTGDPTDIDPMNMIDDFEDGDGLIKAAGDRVGAWYTYNDDTAAGSQTPAAGESFVPTDGGPAGSTFFGETTGSGFTTWGAGVGADLNNVGDPEGGAGIKMPYDASAFTGVAFKARGNVTIRAKLQIAAIVPTTSGGDCAANCDDAHGKAFELTDTWTQYTLPFAEALQEGWGTVAPFDGATLMGVQFQVPANATFEVAIDEIGFY